MKIHIYGIGRSGTKAVQLYLSYLVALKEGNVWINYEPYFWLDRYARIVNYEGLYYHFNSPHFLHDENQLTNGHRKFLQKFNHDGTSVVTKDIRANGRISALDSFLKPDYSFLIIRDLYEVLTSMLKREWDFFSVGWEYVLNWDNFVEEIKKAEIIDNLRWCLERINDRIDRNAFYWYVMNVAALKYNSEKVYLLRFREFQSLQETSKIIFGEHIPYENILSDKFHGENLHTNFPLYSEVPFLSSRRNMVNYLLYKTRVFARFNYFTSYKTIGTLATINHQPPEIKREEIIKTKSALRIEKTELNEFFVESINRMMDAHKQPEIKPYR
jgi:hypothetical protein